MDQPIQLALLAAGCQPWNSQVTAASGKRFAYCATLTVYIFEADEKTGQYVLHSIFAENKQRITCICWHPYDANLLCTTSCNGTVIIWDVEQQKVFKQIKYPKDKPVNCCFYSNCLAFATKSVAVNFWEYNSGQAVRTPPSYNCSFSSDVTIIKFCSLGESGKVLVGHKNGTVSLLCYGRKPQKHVSILDEDDENDNGYESLVTDIQWDPHSTDYALVSRYQCGLIMMDTNNMSVLMRYSMPSRAVYVQCLAWVPGASGTFVTGDQQNGILRIWNVSKAEPLESVKIKTTGFHAMSALQRQTAGIATDSVTAKHQVGAGIVSPIFLVCTFSDGGVGLYDLSLRRWTYLKEKGHTETVFDCKFSTSDATRLATASFDGSVKVWDVSQPELKFECSSPGNEGILYQISWAPSNLNRIAVASAKHGMFIWNISKGKITHRYHDHGHEMCVYTVCWNQIDSTRILTGGADGYAVVRQIDGDGVVRFDHNGAAVYGCEWSPSDQSLFVTGAEDGKVRVFCQPLLGQQGNVDLVCKPVRVFEGHSSKSFQVKFSPLRDGYLASGSDDSTIRIWSYSEAKCMQVLTGHKSNVRGLCWSPEIAYLLYSGSWDYSIILWDIRDGSKLCTLDGHSGDVYGLSIHKNRPFILASSSRDSTVRLWSTYQVVSSLPIAVLAKVSWSEIFATPEVLHNRNCIEVAMATDSPPLLCGKLSDTICRQITSKALDDVMAIQSKFHLLFQYTFGIENLLDLVKVVLGKPESSFSRDYGRGIVHTKHLTRYKQAEAAELDMARQTYRGGQIGAPSRQDKLQQAADIYLRLGNLEKYCLLMVENQQWERALSLAPAVSHKFWNSLLSRYTEYLRANKPSQVLPYQTAMGETEALVNYHLSNGTYSDALMAAVVGFQGSKSFSSEKHSADGAGDDGATEDRDLIRLTTYKMAEHYQSLGQPLSAASTYLSADMVEEGVAALVKSHMVELAFTLALSFNLTQLACEAGEMLLYRCDKLRSGDNFGMNILRTLNSERLATKFCLWNIGNPNSAGLRKAVNVESNEKADQLLKLSAHSPVTKQVRLKLLSSDSSAGLKMGITVICDMMKKKDFVLTSEIEEMLDFMQSVPSDILIAHPILLFDLLTISCYIGALKAVRKGYDIIVRHLLILSERRINFDQSTCIPLSGSQIIKDINAWDRRLSSPQESSDLRSLYRRASFSQDLQSNTLYGPITTPGSTLPSYSDKNKRSIISHTIIKGPVYELEDNESCISLGEAIMWAQVNPFSPISCSEKVALANKINPM